MSAEPSESELLLAFNDLKGDHGKTRPYVDFRGFKSAIEKFRPECMQDFMDDEENLTETCENIFRNMCEGSVANVRAESFNDSMVDDTDENKPYGDSKKDELKKSKAEQLINGELPIEHI
jgi:hypothetical protein